MAFAAPLVASTGASLWTYVSASIFGAGALAVAQYFGVACSGNRLSDAAEDLQNATALSKREIVTREQLQKIEAEIAARVEKAVTTFQKSIADREASVEQMQAANKTFKAQLEVEKNLITLRQEELTKQMQEIQVLLQQIANDKAEIQEQWGLLDKTNREITQQRAQIEADRAKLTEIAEALAQKAREITGG